MQTYQPSPWMNLHTYFRLGFWGSNGFVLLLALGLTYYFLFFARLNHVESGLLLFLMCHQFASIYLQKTVHKKIIPQFSQMLFTVNPLLSFQLSLCCFGLAYPFIYFQNSEYITTLYTLFFVLFSPVIVCCLLSTKNLLRALNPILWFTFIFRRLPVYFFCFVTIVLMGLGYKTVHYYVSNWLTSEAILLVDIGLAAYLFLVCAYVFADLVYEDPTSLYSNAETQDLNYLKKYIASGHYDYVHDFFKPNALYTRSINLLDFYLKFLFTLQDEKRIYSFGNRWINLLFLQNNVKKAVSVYETIFKKYPYFNLSEPLINYNLAKQFFLSKQTQIVIHLLKNLSEQSPEFRHLPEALLMLAKSYMTINLDIKAKQSLDMITQRFSASDAYTEALTIQKILTANGSKFSRPMA